MTSERADKAPQTCPECGQEPATDLFAEFGYCGNCRDFHAAQAAFTAQGPAVYVEPRKNTGGLYRCCTMPMNAWAAMNPAPWDYGTAVPCMYHGWTEGHGMILGRNDIWVKYPQPQDRW